MTECQRFWIGAIAGFVVIITLVGASLAAPRFMMGMPVELYWMREPLLYVIAGVNATAIASYFVLIAWLDQ